MVAMVTGGEEVWDVVAMVTGGEEVWDVVAMVTKPDSRMYPSDSNAGSCVGRRFWESGWGGTRGRN